MGKFSGSLEKAGYDVGLEELHNAEKRQAPPGLNQATAAQQPSTPPPEDRPAEQPAAATEPAVAPAEPAIEAAKQPDQPVPPQAQKPIKVKKPRSGPAVSPSISLENLQGIWDQRLFKAVNDDIQLPEIFKVIRSRILDPGEGRAVPKTILVTSVVPREGKSFITANLGISLARDLDQHCLMVDCDLRRPSLGGLFGLKSGTGLADYLQDRSDLPALIGKTGVNKLSLLPSGKPPVNPAELLSSARMQTMIDELSARYEDRIILFDSPPMLIAAETTVLAGKVDAVLLVVRQGTAGKAQVKKLIDTFGAERILGVVFNGYQANTFEKTVAKNYNYYYQGSYS